MTPAEQHDRIVNSTVGWLLAFACIPMWWWDYHFPSWVVAILNPALIIGITWGFSRWKRSAFSRALFWVVLVIYAASFAVQVCTAFSGWEVASGFFTTGGAILLTLVWVLWRLPRLRPAEPNVSHVVHHHVVHAPGAILPPGADVLPGMVPQVARPAIPARVLRAIEAPKAHAGAAWRVARAKVTGRD